MPFPNLNGRPRKYKDQEICEKLNEYIKECGTKDNIPTAEGFSVFAGITMDTVNRYSKNKELYSQFSDAYRQLMALQAEILINKGLKGDYNSLITKLMLHNHGYTDKTQNNNTNVNTEVEGDEDEPVEDKLQKVLGRIQKLRKD
jgi:hypothetical protein